MNDLGHAIDITRRANDMGLAVVAVVNSGMHPKEERAGIYHAYAMSQKRFIEALTRQYSISKRLPRLPRQSKQTRIYARMNKVMDYQWRLLMQRYPELKKWMDHTDKKLHSLPR